MNFSNFSLLRLSFLLRTLTFLSTALTPAILDSVTSALAIGTLYFRLLLTVMMVTGGVGPESIFRVFLTTALFSKDIFDHIVEIKLSRFIVGEDLG